MKVVARLRWAVLVGLMACTLWGGAPVRAAASDSGLDIPSDLFFAPQPRIRFPSGDTPRLGQTLEPFLPRAYRGYYRGWGWRWRRADRPRPAPQDVETVADRASYAVQFDDVGYFLSACIHIAVAPDIASEYCTDFAGPVTDPTPTCASFKPPPPSLGGAGAWFRPWTVADGTFSSI